VTIDQILREVAEKYSEHGVTVIELKSKCRTKPLTTARFEAYWRCRQETRHSLPTIGRHIGFRDHTTILYGVRKHEERMKEESEGC